MEQEKAIPLKEVKEKRKSSVNKSFRKHNKLGFYRFIQKKKKNSTGKSYRRKTSKEK